jgi:streptogramin lyase
MTKKIILLLLFVTAVHRAQTNQLWKGYFSYNGIKDITQTNNVFLAASENAIFSKNISTNEIQTINTIDGLSSQNISTIYASQIHKKTLIGYENGLLLLIDNADNKIYRFFDIINKSLPPTIKKINHFFEQGNTIYISCDFGIVQFNIATLLFGETYFIGSTVSDIKVNQTTIFNGRIFAATQDNGLKSADPTNPNLIDASQWTTVVQGSFQGIVSLPNVLVCTQLFGQNLRSADGITFSNINPFLSPSSKSIRVAENQIIIATENQVLVYDNLLVLTSQINRTSLPDIPTSFTTATILGNKIYIGTDNKGVVTLTTGTSTFEYISPSGPVKNEIFSINAQSSQLYAVYGSYKESLEPLGIQLGYSKCNLENGWTNYPISATDNVYDLVRVTVNPTNENQIFIASHQNGLLKLENSVLIKRFDQTNSGLETLVVPGLPNYFNVRIEEPAFDRRGNLWLTNGIIKSPLKVLQTNGQWQSYNMEATLNDWTDARFSKLMIDKNNTKWMVSRSDGLIGFNEAFNNKFKRVAVGPEPGNLPSIIQTAAIDTRNQVWIGTRRGLRILNSVDAFLDDQPMKANSIIILDNGLAQELLFEQFITDIVVDGANNKWVGTADAGVFQFSPNGQQTLHHFTSENSPLPNNNVNDIDINPTTGEVFFATTKGMVSFKGTAIKAADNLENVVVFPNPVRPEFDGNLTITGLTNKANIKITDIEGNLVFEAISEGGSVEWNTTAFGKYRVASGVYIVFIASKDGLATKVKKIMIVR